MLAPLRSLLPFYLEIQLAQVRGVGEDLYQKVERRDGFDLASPFVSATTLSASFLVLYDTTGIILPFAKSCLLTGDVSRLSACPGPAGLQAATRPLPPTLSALVLENNCQKLTFVRQVLSAGTCYHMIGSRSLRIPEVARLSKTLRRSRKKRGYFKV